MTKVERGGFFMLLLFLATLIIVEIQPTTEIHGLIDFDSDQVKSWQLVYDSIVDEQNLRSKKIFPFNPNFISPAKADRLAMSAEELKQFQVYRQSGKWINSLEEFQRVTGVTNSWMKEYSELFRFPEFSKNKAAAISTAEEKIPFSHADIHQLMNVKGVGSAMAERIIRARDKWGGIGYEPELMMIYGITPAIKQSLLQSFSYDQKSIKVRNINKLNSSDLTEIPGINFSLAKIIWAFVRLRQGLSKLEELLLLDEIEPRLFEVIQLYLYAMKNEPDGLPRS